MRRHLILACCWMVLTAGTALAERYAVSASKANIRSGPGTNYDWLWQAGKYYPLDVEQKKGNWYYFKDFEGDAGWIHKSLIDKISTVITVKDKCNIRKGPSTTYDIAFTVGPGIPFRVVEKKGNWIRVEHADGDKGWIHKSLVW